MKNYIEQTDMERLLTKLSKAMLDDEGENDIHRMFHNAKGCEDAVPAVYELIMNLVAYKKAAQKDMKFRLKQEKFEEEKYQQIVSD